MTIGTGLTGIGSGAFALCDRISTVIFKGDAPTAESWEGVFTKRMNTVVSFGYVGYPMNNATWTNAAKESLGHGFEWKSLTDAEINPGNTEGTADSSEGTTPTDQNPPVNTDQADEPGEQPSKQPFGMSCTAIVGALPMLLATLLALPMLAVRTKEN